MPHAVPTPWSDLPAPPRMMVGVAPSAQTPLAGLTILLVEDSRFACDALRFVTQRAGGRLRRAESLAQARHHLRTYRPDLAVIDLGLPDGRGEDLIADMRRHGGPPILAISGEDDGRARSLQAGAGEFLGKPLGSIGAICQTFLRLLPDRAWLIPAMLDPSAAPADPLALRDDLAQAARRLAEDTGAPGRSYVAGFVAGVARSARDPALEAAAGGARDTAQAEGRLARALAERLSPAGPLTHGAD